jgi:hypothetical protein
MSSPRACLLLLLAACASPRPVTRVTTPAPDLETAEASAYIDEAFRLDALIREGKTLPAAQLIRLDPRFTNQITILLLRQPPGEAPAILSFLDRLTPGSSAWLALANWMVIARAPQFAPRLLRALPTRAQLTIVGRWESAHWLSGDDFGTGISTALGIPGRPRPIYRLFTEPGPRRVLASGGPYPIYYRRYVGAPEFDCEIDGGGSALTYAVNYLQALSGLDAGAMWKLRQMNHVLEEKRRQDQPAAIARIRRDHRAAWLALTAALKEHGVLGEPAPPPTLSVSVIDETGFRPGGATR